VEVLLENIPSGLSSPERLVHFLEATHLPLGVCFDTGYAHLSGSIEAGYTLLATRIRSTHLHDNDGKEDSHLLPLVDPGGTIDWRRAMQLLRSRDPQYPLVLEAREPGPASGAARLDAARESFRRLESL
jgi:sugar phosphate isomerase/epimerase